MNSEPGGAFVRLAVSLKAEDEQRLMKLRAYFEGKTGERHSLAKVVRSAIICLAERDGVE